MFGTKEIVVKVIFLIPELKMAYIETADQWRYCFTKDTPTVDIDTVKKGQTYKCIVEDTDLPKVLSATLIKE
jgi:hypothetical protein